MKSPSAFRFIGKDVPRLDIPAKTTGAAEYAIDVQVRGMVYAGVLHSAYEGGAPETIDDRVAREITGITGVVRLPGGVAVIGTSVEATQAAKNKLKVTWSAAPTATYDSERALIDYSSSWDGTLDVRWNASDSGVARPYASQLIGLMPDLILAAGTTNLTEIQQATNTRGTTCLSHARPSTIDSKCS